MTLLSSLHKLSEFKLINSKIYILGRAAEALQGCTLDFEEFMNALQSISTNEDVEELEHELDETLYNLTNTEDENIPDSVKIELLCEKINDLNWPDEIDIYTELRIPNKFIDSQDLNMKEINELYQAWIKNIIQNEEEILYTKIKKFREIEINRSNYINQLEEELITFRKFAEKLLEKPKIEENWYNELTIIQDAAYCNDFKCLFIDKEFEIIENCSDELNELELYKIQKFFNLVKQEVNIN
jgi:hypothetical protein